MRRILNRKYGLRLFRFMTCQILFQKKFLLFSNDFIVGVGFQFYFFYFILQHFDNYVKVIYGQQKSTFIIILCRRHFLWPFGVCNREIIRLQCIFVLKNSLCFFLVLFCFPKKHRRSDTETMQVAPFQERYKLQKKLVEHRYCIYFHMLHVYMSTQFLFMACKLPMVPTIFIVDTTNNPNHYLVYPIH